MPIDDVPILEIVIRQLANHGFDDVTLAVGHLAELLMAYCGDGSKFNIGLSYSREEAPLGTAGPIALIPDLSETFLVMNGDLLTTLDFGEMLRYHQERGAIATLATCQREAEIDLGVIESDENQWVTDYIEKPTFHYSVSMGVYVFEPGVLEYVSRGEPLDLPELVLRLLSQGRRVSNYCHNGYWLDMGRPDDHQKAIQEFQARREVFLPEV
jgi:NDP-sugar pyrophosphorylase family protein